MEIRPETEADAAAIAAVTSEAFASAPHASGTEAAIVAALRAADALTLSLVAVEDGAVVGHVAFSPVAVGSGEPGWYGLGPVSVRPDRQGRGIGTALVRAGLGRLRRLDAEGCVLVGDPGFYGRFGFASDPELTCAGVPAEYFQRAVFLDRPPKGQVVFHRAFGVEADGSASSAGP